MSIISSNNRLALSFTPALCSILQRYTLYGLLLSWKNMYKHASLVERCTICTVVILILSNFCSLNIQLYLHACAELLSRGQY